ncbi:MAG: rod shape-determining protein MreD [Lachnospiraceae bacterium]
MKRILINLALLIAAFTIQSCIFPLMPFISASPNLLLIITFSIGFIEGQNAGMLYGLLAGILLDLFYSGPFGFYSLIYIYIGYMNGKCTKYYYEDYITLPLFLCVVNELAYNLYIYVFRFLIRGRLDFLYYFREIILPEIIFTTIVTLLVYRLFLFITRQLEELEKRRGTKIV